MNPFILKAVGFIKKITASGLIKPLPLSGLGKEITKVIESKNKGKAALRLTGYIISGLIIIAVLFNGFPLDKALRLLEVFGF